MKQELWAIDLKLTHSDSLAQMKLMQYVTNGSFDPERSIFQVPIVTTRSEPTQAISRRRKTLQEEEVYAWINQECFRLESLSYLPI